MEEFERQCTERKPEAYILYASLHMTLEQKIN